MKYNQLLEKYNKILIENKELKEENEQLKKLIGSEEKQIISISKKDQINKITKYSSEEEKIKCIPFNAYTKI